ncbi:MAG: aldehyde ferredoxin oxidoreductase family protein [Candidatus Limivicinus sp.]
MTKYCGYMGKVLLLDLSTREVSDYVWTDLAREKYIGGKAMASKILFDNLTGKEAPFGEDNLIVIATGPLTGTGAPSSNRFDISSLSPLTGITASSNCGGNFGHYLKKAGLDALIIRGRCPEPTWVEIDNGVFRFHPAEALWGMKVGETHATLEEALKEEHGKTVRCGVVAIGPAGENLVRYASVMSGERAAGRAGMGAVFGSKNLKAIVAFGDAVPTVYDREKAAGHNKRWVQSIRSGPLTGDQLPKLGTAGLVSPMQVRRLLSTHNYAKGQFEHFEAVSGEALAENLNLSNNGCLSCPIRCSRRVPVDGKTVKGPELETLGLLGGNIENADLEKICRWNYELDDLGMDTISCASTIAWAMEANEKGLWQSGLRFGETDQLSQVFDDIAHRRGIGDELAEGSKRLSEKYGGKEFAIHAKGMELAAYEPRRAVGQGLGYAVANRGGCHLNGGYLVVLEGLGLNVNGQTPRGKADLCMLMQDLMESISMGGQCLFTSYGVLPNFLVRKPNSPVTKAVNAAIPHLWPVVRILNKFPEIACFNLPLLPYPLELRYTVGMNMNIGKFIRAGERSYNVERAVNARFGVSAENDSLPKRLTDVPQDPKNPKTKVPLEQMKKSYYRARGWEKNGLPSEGKLRQLGIL